MAPEPDRLAGLLSTMGGSALYGLFTLYGVIQAGHAPSRLELLQAAANVVFGIAAGAILGWLVVPHLVAIFPIAALREIHLLGVAVGALAWVGLPFIFKGWTGYLAKKAAEVSK